MPNHTPGPWTMFCTEDGAIGVVGSNNTDVALCRKSKGWPMDSSRSLEEDEANARLIAAAPETAAERDRLKEVNAELLAALTEAVDLIDNRFGHALTRKEMPLVEQWRAAIAKAEGKS